MKQKRLDLDKRERERERERKKIIVWALYDDANSSYKKGISKFFDDYNLEVHSIGINNIIFPKSEKYFYHKIDLSLNNLNLIKQMSNLPKPDIILASPPCESWSGADCAGRIIRKIDEKGNWFVQNSNYYENYNKTCKPVKRRNFIQKEEGRIIGESTIGATIKIIKKFDPFVWVIENPKTSKTWDFQKYHWNFLGEMNDTYYSSYDEKYSLKPTIFKSNIKIKLKKNRKSKTNKDHMALGSYSKRSSIPAPLIKDMFEQILDYVRRRG